MDSAEAVRFVTLHFLDTYKSSLEEDNYESARTLIEATPKDKVVQRVTKFIRPFAEASEKNQFSKAKLLKDGWITKDCTMSPSDIKEMGKQAEMAYSLCCAITEMDPEKLRGIEQMALSIQKVLESQIEDMSEEQRSNMNPADLIAGLMGDMGDVAGGEDIANVVGGLMKSLTPQAPPEESKKSLMDSFSKIDGNIAKR